MRLRFTAPAIAGAMILCAPVASRADPFENCRYDCAEAHRKALATCTGKTGELLRNCQQRAERTRASCTERCNAAENRRLRLLQARGKDAAERRKLRGQ
jgi:hypothetical protein